VDAPLADVSTVQSLVPELKAKGHKFITIDLELA